MTQVKWREVKGFYGRYYISNNGLVWSRHGNKLLSPAIDRYGYEKVTPCVNGKSFYRTVHRLVAQAFIDNPLGLPTVNHINEIKTDNRVENLEWTDVKTNVNHGTRNQRMADSKSTKPVEQIFPNGYTIIYKGVKDASRKTGINRCCIASCCKNIRKTAGGCKWRYINETN